MSNTDLLSSDAANAAATSSDSQGGANGTAPRKRPGLSGMVLAELRELAGQLGLSGTAGMRKGDLIAAIKERQASGSPRANGRTAPAKGGQTELPVAAAAPPATEPVRQEAREGRDNRAEGRTARDDRADADTRDNTRENTRDGDRNRRRRTASRPAGSPDGGGNRDADDTGPNR
ncbi:MAG TPA: Rho termination factor N-terminal domain-containing protein, partial [Pseudonocardiaceae bacterium]|nr:Rho termination factor N-terminal domain-containing protein [Pseudonocardiaceae bacterium]